MALDIDKVEAILRQHWQIPSEYSSTKLQQHAGRIHVLVRQKYSHDNLKYQLGLIQMTKLSQKLNDQACNQIAADLLRDAG
jgi:hypothetical protein